MTLKCIATSAVLLAASVSAPAMAAVIDFNEFTSGGTQFVNPFDSAGFHFENNGGSANALGVWGSSSPFNMDPGGAAILHNFSGTITTVTKVGGGFFDLNSINLSDVYNGSFGGDVLLTFTDGLGTTSQTVALDNNIGGQTFALNRTGLTAFTLQGITTQGGWLQFDNVVVDGAVSASVPEPATWAMMLLGFGFVGAAMRKSRQAARVNYSFA